MTLQAYNCPIPGLNLVLGAVQLLDQGLASHPELWTRLLHNSPMVLAKIYQHLESLLPITREHLNAVLRRLLFQLHPTVELGGVSPQQKDDLASC